MAFYRREIEAAPREAIRAHQARRLREFLAQVKAQNAFYREKIGAWDPASLSSPDDLRALPFTTKAELVAEQAVYPPLGRFHTFELGTYGEYHQTSGTTGHPLKILDTPDDWANCWAEQWLYVWHAAGVSAQDIIYFGFSFGPFIGFWAGYRGAQILGALSVSGGGQDTTQRLQMLHQTGATVLCCTPTYALRLAECAAEIGLDLAHDTDVRTLVVAGEPGASIPTVRQRIEAAWAARCFDHAGASEVGAWGFACSQQTGLHVNEALFVAEVLDAQTGEPVAEGGVGELVLTGLDRLGLPCLRYRTGDLVRHGGHACPCGRTFLHLLGGVIGRIDDMVVVRGINVYPSAIEAIVREFPEVAEFRLFVRDERGMATLRLQVESGDDSVSARLGEACHARLALRVPVEVIPPGSLPRFELKARRVVDERR